jgi:hypothetical protein
MPTALVYKSCWQAPGYRSPKLTFVDPASGREYECSLSPRDLQRVILECAESAKQISSHPPIDWDEYPRQVYWPSITPWVPGPSAGTGRTPPAS